MDFFLPPSEGEDPLPIKLEPDKGEDEALISIHFPNLNPKFRGGKGEDEAV